MKYTREEIIGVIGQIYACSCALKRYGEIHEVQDEIERATNLCETLEELGELLGIDMEVKI